MSSPQQKQIKTRKEGIMKKAFQLNHMYPDIRIAVIFHIDGKNHIYRSSNTNAWPPSMAEMQSMHPEPENWLNYDFQTAREVVASDGLDPEESIGSSPYIGLGFADTDPVEGDADIVPAHPVAQQNAAKINPYTSSAMHAAVLSGGWNFEEPTSISSSPAPAIAAMPQHQTSTPLSHSVQPSRAVSQTPPVSGAASAIEVQALGNSYNVNSEDIFGDLGNKVVVEGKI
ncbi:hypothetical protein H2199_003961 [Coniosporium tulheliwenetii]|uniref:Uncharacterized protein n=1 Tax=Coniosporium tulheliwenetii TaxID=3383036 RepID=A0ACC2Z9Z7_9PEZI|nr:hypothetical protein H2199_003961 [Cladosporium sp. JES 115]